MTCSSHLKNGAVTLYLAISFSLLLTLICYTIESCHLGVLASRADSVSYISADSLLGNYCLPLFEKYGLFCLNEQGLDLKSLLTDYAKNNCQSSPSLLYGYESFLNLSLDDIDITDVHYITDNDAKDFVEQICEHVKYLELTNLANELLDSSNEDIPEVFEQSEDGLPNIDFDSIDPTIYTEYISGDMVTNGKTDEDLSNIDSDSFSSSISESIGHLIKNSLLSCILKDPSTVSSLSIDKTVVPSVTCELTMDGINASYGYYKDVSLATYEKACFCEYITHTFGNYLDTSETSALKYQTEYIISGSPDDDTNLINTSLQLISLRTGLNLVHLISDKSKFNAAWKIAKSASSIPLAPYIIQATILTVWATAESIIDVRDLLGGKSVPLIKTKDQWTLSIQGLKNFSKDTASSNDGLSGLSYERYLEMLLIFQNNISVYYRTLDLIQVDICKEYSDNFRISRCLTGIDIEFTYSLPYLIITNSQTYKRRHTYKYQ